MIKRLKKAFTITELVIVIAVIAILAAVLIPTFSNVIERANQSAALQTCTNALKDYQALAIDEETGVADDMDGIVFVNDGYAYVYLNSQLHYIGETKDLMKVNTTYAISNKIDEAGTILPVPTNETGTASVTVSFTKDSDTTKVIFQAAAGTNDATTTYYNLAAVEDSVEGVVDGKAAEVVYFYEIEINKTAYAGYFTLEQPAEDDVALYQIQSANYSHLYGVMPEGVGTMAIAVTTGA